MAIAIDFGTSNTVITRWNAVTEQAEIVKLPGLSQQIANNPSLIPSLVYVENAEQGKVILGQEVRDRGLDISNDTRFFRSFKRGIGSQIQGFLPELDGKTVTFEDVGAWFLHQILEKAQKEPSIELDSLIITVPVDSFEAYRHWLTKVCQAWSIPQILMIDEPTAAALGYGTRDGETLLVIDFGGGTVDFSLVQLNFGASGTPQGLIVKWGQKILGNNQQQQGRTARVLGKAGQNLGGTDIDNWLVDYFAQSQDLPKSSLTSRLAERLKIQLSTVSDAHEVYFNDQTFESYELELNRQQLHQILEDNQFFSQLDELLNQVLQQGKRNGIDLDNIDAVLLVGGTVQIPAVQTWIGQYFPETKIKAYQPFTAIAQGALQLAKGLELKDFLYHSYGIRYWNRRDNRHSWHPIIQRGQSYPMEKPVEIYLGASLDNQPSIELIIGELGEETRATEVFFDGDRLITRALGSDITNVKPLNDREGARTIATLNPLGYPGSDRIKVQFWVDQQRVLKMTVEDLLINETLLNQQIVAELS